MKKYLLLIMTASVLLPACGGGEKRVAKGGKDRLVCVSKQLTEFLFALHQGEKIVG
ncbi:MAG: ABC transporter substrate-binding protein, partial [Chitinophagaceae bacterium]